jgi:xanthosine utilization system XapX-like protein
MDKTKLGQILGTAGILTGLMYSVRKKKGIGPTVLWTGIFGVAGVLIGNSITKYYE